MSLTVCLTAGTFGYPDGGGHFWVHLNWALGLRALGCRVLWLEAIRADLPLETMQIRFDVLQRRLKHYGFTDCLALCTKTAEPMPSQIAANCLSAETAMNADLLLNMRFDLSLELVGRFRRSVMVDIDPGILQCWMANGEIKIAPHDVYFTIGETVGRPEAKFPDAGIQWHYTPPCVALDYWPTASAAEGAFTTVSHWHTVEWIVEQDGSFYRNDKRNGFLPFLDLPSYTRQPLELALALGGDPAEQAALEQRGWRVREAHEVAAQPWDYQRYVQQSRGEFSCVKPSCIRFENAWVSDRTLCYLASGKPAVVQHTGASRLLPDRAGLFRFRAVEEAAHCLETVAADYERQSRLARALAEEYFDARKVVGNVLERALA